MPVSLQRFFVLSEEELDRLKQRVSSSTDADLDTSFPQTTRQPTPYELTVQRRWDPPSAGPQQVLFSQSLVVRIFLVGKYPRSVDGEAKRRRELSKQKTVFFVFQNPMRADSQHALRTNVDRGAGCGYATAGRERGRECKEFLLNLLRQVPGFFLTTNGAVGFNGRVVSNSNIAECLDALTDQRLRIAHVPGAPLCVTLLSTGSNVNPDLFTDLNPRTKESLAKMRNNFSKMYHCE